jgi:hypothetical protein
MNATTAPTIAATQKMAHVAFSFNSILMVFFGAGKGNRTPGGEDTNLVPSHQALPANETMVHLIAPIRVVEPWLVKVAMRPLAIPAYPTLLGGPPET